MLPTNFGSFGHAVSEEKIFSKLTNQKQELPMAAMLLSDRDKMSNLYRGPSIDASYQVSVHLAMRFQRRRFFRNQPIRNKNCLWWPCLLTDRDEMSNLYRGPSIDASYQVSVHLAKGFQRRRLKCEKLTDDGIFHRCFLPGFGSFGRAASEEKIKKKRPIRNKNCLWWPCLLIDMDKMSIL